ncbi:MAG: hypothetical protein KatS3mg124_0956 [Porticoccaceae bacterium]|nr:MAG: hypothetical protein KatS3mg124_0956 [Porticoccaceae bacterium]
MPESSPSSAGRASEFAFEIAPGAGLTAPLNLVGAALAAALLLAPLAPAGARWLLLGWFALAWASAVGRLGRWARWRLRWSARGVRLVRDGREEAVRLRFAFVSRRLLVVELHLEEGERLCLPCTPAGGDSEAWRRLQVAARGVAADDHLLSGEVHRHQDGVPRDG